MQISVALCTFNGEKFLSQQLQSIFSQTVNVNEIVICDDCSTDKTEAIIKQFNLTYSGIIKLFINDKNIGGRKNFENALSLCTGDIIFLCDQDDIWMEDKVEKMMQVFIKDPTCCGVFSNGFLIDEENKSIDGSLLDFTFFKKEIRANFTKDQLFYWSIILGNIVTGATMAIRKSTLSYIIPFKLNFKQRKFWHDGWISAVLFSKGKLEYLDECLIKYRLHPVQQVGIDLDRYDFFEDILVRDLHLKSLTNLKETYQRYLIGYLFMKEFNTLQPVDTTIYKKIEQEYKILKKKYFNSQPFFKKKLRLLKWYINSMNEITLSDLVKL